MVAVAVVSVVVLSGCATESGSSDNGGSYASVTWPDEILARHFVQDEVGVDNVVCKPSAGDEFTCKDTDFGVCYRVGTRPSNGGTLHGREIGPC